jgi:hypothetical protein
MLHEGPVGCCQNHANIGFDVDIRNSEAQLNAQRVPCGGVVSGRQPAERRPPRAGRASARRPQHGHAVAAARRAGRSRSREPSRGVGRGSEPAAASDPPPGRRAHPGRSGSRPRTLLHTHRAPALMGAPDAAAPAGRAAARRAHAAQHAPTRFSLSLFLYLTIRPPYIII